MEYLYFLANASLTLRLVEYLHALPEEPVKFITVIHQIDGWIVRVKTNTLLDDKKEGDLRAFMNELGFPYSPQLHLKMAFLSLEMGQKPIKVMRRYQIALVSHGSPNKRDIEAFRHQFTKGLGYCPETLT